MYGAAYQLMLELGKDQDESSSVSQSSPAAIESSVGNDGGVIVGGLVIKRGEKEFVVRRERSRDRKSAKDKEGSVKGGMTNALRELEEDPIKFLDEFKSSKYTSKTLSTQESVYKNYYLPFCRALKISDSEEWDENIARHLAAFLFKALPG